MNAIQLINAFGGTGKVATLLGVGPSCVSNWKSDGLIPARWFFRLRREAAERGLEISEEAFRDAA